MRKLNHKETLSEGFGSFMKKVGAGIGATTRELGKQLAKDAPGLVGAAKGIAGIVKDINATDPIKAVEKYFKDDDYAREHYKDDIRERNALGRPTQDPNNRNMFIIPINKGTYADEKGGKEEVMDLAGGQIKVLQSADNTYQFTSVTTKEGKSIGPGGGPVKPVTGPDSSGPAEPSKEPESVPESEKVTDINFREKLQDFSQKNHKGKQFNDQMVVKDFVKSLAKNKGKTTFDKNYDREARQYKTDRKNWSNKELDTFITRLQRAGVLSESQKNLLKHLHMISS